MAAIGPSSLRAGGAVPWWRVVNASGRPPAAHADAAIERLLVEGTPLCADGTRVRLSAAIWWPDQSGPVSG